MELLAPSVTSTPTARTRAGAPPASTRLPFIDNLRWVMIILVVCMHAIGTYSNEGLWYYREPTPINRSEQVFLFFFDFFLKTFRMGVLFFLAGYFVPGTLARKGPRRFLKDRTYRLGWPTLFYIILLNPITGYLAAYHRTTGEPITTFLREFANYILHGVFLRGLGPLWYCAVLLFFSFVYAAWRILIPVKNSSGSRPFPRDMAIVAFSIIVALATFLARMLWPIGKLVYDMQLAYFPQYIAFFIAGTMAYRQGWLKVIPAATGKRWGLTALFGGPICLMALTILSGGFKADPAVFVGGWHWQSLALSILEAFTGFGISLGCITLFRDRFNRQGPFAAFLSANFFAVYVFHSTVLVAISRAMAGWHGEAIVKVAVATVLTVVVTYALSGTVFRRIPVLKNIL
jgi:peptidoglycan/LPS O-acetylase OafA/YrhL